MYRPVNTFSTAELNDLYIEIENELRTGKNFVEIAKILEQKYGIVFAEAEYMIQQVKLKSFGNVVIKPPKDQPSLLKTLGGIGLIVAGGGLLILFLLVWNIGIPRFAIVAILAGIAVVFQQIFDR